jgi:hypothetical protein
MPLKKMWGGFPHFKKKQGLSGELGKLRQNANNVITPPPSIPPLL